MNPTRQRILKIIRAQPGVQASHLARLLRIHPSSPSHHLRKLEKQGIITYEQDGNHGHKQYYLASGPMCRKARRVHARLTDAGRTLLSTALDKGSVGLSCLKDQGVSRSAANWAANLYQDLGVLEKPMRGTYHVRDAWVSCVEAALHEAACDACRPGPAEQRIKHAHGRDA